MDAACHDGLRSVPGALEGALAGIENLKKAGMEFQVNTTITERNLGQIGNILDLAVDLGAVAHHFPAGSDRARTGYRGQDLGRRLRTNPGVVSRAQFL